MNENLSRLLAIVAGLTAQEQDQLLPILIDVTTKFTKTYRAARGSDSEASALPISISHSFSINMSFGP